MMCTFVGALDDSLLFLSLEEAAIKLQAIVGNDLEV
jgi:hypothetical protein